MQVKTIVDNGWVLHNRFVGMPTGLNFHDFPLPDNLHFLIAKLLSYVVPDATLIMNLYFLATFPLTFITSLFVFRSFSISYLPAIAGGLIFSFLPYHFYRGEAHLFLASYYLIPLTIMVVLRIARGDALFGKRTRLETVSCVAIYALTASGGVYYAFFGAFFLLVAGVIGAVRAGSWRPPMFSGILTAVLCLAFLVNLAPNIIYSWRHGVNRQATVRVAGEADHYGLTISQLLLPIQGHRLSYFRKLREKYHETRLTPTNENDFASFGTIGSIGFLLLLSWPVWLLRSETQGAPTALLLTDLSVLNIAGVLLATVGGFGSILALLAVPEIRAYNRISVYLGFFSIFAVVLLLEKLILQRITTSRGRVLSYGFLAAIALIAILDQTNRHFVPPYRRIETEHASDRDFVNRIESSVPRDAMIFQLPYVPFPGNPPVHRMVDYDHFRGYLHSKTLRWSYGAMRGREADAWQLQVANRPIDELIASLAFVDFEGVYVDRYGYPDLGAALVRELSERLGDRRLSSRNGRLVFFSLGDFKAALRNRYSADEWERMRNLTLVAVQWGHGFWPMEGTPDNNWRWSRSESELSLVNLSSGATEVILEMRIATGRQEFANLRMESSLFSETLRVNAVGQFFSKRLTIPPGRHSINFLCDAPPIKPPGDPRLLVFRVINPRLNLPAGAGSKG